MQKLKQILFIVVLALTAGNPVLAMAQTNTNTGTVTTTNIDTPVYQNVQQSVEAYLCTPADNGERALEKCVNKLYRFGISFGAIALVFFLVFAGYVYITGGEGAKGKAKGIVQNALVGIALLLGSYVLLRFINPELVVFKPIQPPIFTAADIPTCESVGFGEDCIVEGEDSPVVTSAKGGYANCPDGIIAFDKKIIPVNQGNDTEQVCKAFWEKLKQIHAKTKITVTATIGPGHDSNCHKSGTPVSGVCADMAPQNGNWEELCASIKAVGGMAILNESGKSGPICGAFVKTPKWSGAHLHIYLTSGGGSGGTSSSGSRPNCTSVSNTPGVCDDGLSSGTRYQAGDFASADPAVKVAFDKLKAKYPGIKADQVYRAPQYGAHMRSVFEVKAYQAGWTEAEVKSHGQYCGTQGIQYVTAAQAKDPKTIAYANTHFGHHFTNLSSPTTCYSDHGRGLAVDIDNLPSNMTQFLSDARSFGLCRTVKIYTTKGTTSRADTPHFALFNKLPGGSSNCVTY